MENGKGQLSPDEYFLLASKAGIPQQVASCKEFYEGKMSSIKCAHEALITELLKLIIGLNELAKLKRLNITGIRTTLLSIVSKLNAIDTNGGYNHLPDSQSGKI